MGFLIKIGILPIIYSIILVILALIDLKTRKILNIITYPVIVGALIANLFIPQFLSVHNFLFGLLGLVVGFLLFLLPRFINKSIWGLGDVKMAAMIGAMVGFPHILLAVMGGIILGGTVITILISRHWSGRLPFAPYLAASGILIIFFGSQFVHWYLHLFNVH